MLLSVTSPRYRWTEALLWVLLGIRSTIKEDSKCTAAEIVYGSPLHVPGEVVSPHPTDHTFAGQLRATMTSLSPLTSRRLPATSSHVPTTLGSHALMSSYVVTL